MRLCMDLEGEPLRSLVTEVITNDWRYPTFYIHTAAGPITNDWFFMSVTCIWIGSIGLDRILPFKNAHLNFKKHQ